MIASFRCDSFKAEQSRHSSSKFRSQYAELIFDEVEDGERNYSASSDKKASEDLASAPCMVTGRVVAAAEGSPLKSARVALIPEHSRSHNQIYAATSDVDGRFIIKDIPPGRYRFFANHIGFVEQQYKAGNNDTGPLVSLRAGEKVSDALFRMTAAAVITGRVSNEDGDAMPRVQIVALRRPNEEETEDEPPLPSRKMQMQAVSSAQSDDRGQYRIFGLKPAEYYIRGVTGRVVAAAEGSPFRE